MPFIVLDRIIYILLTHLSVFSLSVCVFSGVSVVTIVIQIEAIIQIFTNMSNNCVNLH